MNKSFYVALSEFYQNICISKLFMLLLFQMKVHLFKNLDWFILIRPKKVLMVSCKYKDVEVIWDKWYFKMIIECTFLLLLKEHPSSHQLSSFLRQSVKFHFSLNSQQILINKIWNNRQCSITSYCEEILMIFYENS